MARMRTSSRFLWRSLPRLLAGLAALAAGGGAGCLRAQEDANDVEVEWQTRTTASADLATGGAKVAQWYSSVDLSLPVAGSRAYGLGVDVTAERQAFRFDDFGDFLPGRSAPLADATLLGLQPTLVLTPTRQWSLIAVVLAQYAGADGASSGGAMLLGGSLAATYQFTPSLKLGLAVELDPRMKAAAEVYPVPLIDWRISDRWSLTSLDGETGRLAYVLGGAWSVFGQLEFQEQDIRLRRSSSIPSGILHYEEYPASLGLLWKPVPHLSVSLWGGEALDQSYQFKDQNGGILRTSSAHAPLIGTFDLDYSF